MKWRMLISAGVLLASVWNGSARGQTTREPGNSTLQQFTRQATERHIETVNEDIEIMRRLLARKLTGREGASTHSIYPTLASYLTSANRLQLAAADPYHSWRGTVNTAGTAATGSIEGVYLARKGAVFTLTLPWTGQDPLPTTTTSTPKVVSEWERARQQLRGEPIKPVASSEPASPSIADIILKVLVENGKNMRIGNDDDVTVVVTFRSDNPFASTKGNLYPPIDPVATPTPVVDYAPSVNTTPEGKTANPGTTARDLLLLGDLHLRQKQYHQAVEAFQKVITIQPDGDPKQLADVFRNLAETKLQLGQLDEAKAMIESAVEWEKKAKQPAATEAAKPEAKAPPQWPAKLIVTASKRQLDDVGSGKMSAEDFRKSVKVELVSPKTK